MLIVHRPWRRWPSIALILGSPLAVTVARVRTLIPVMRAAMSRALRVWSGEMIRRRCPLACSRDASRSRCIPSSSASVSRIRAIVPAGRARGTPTDPGHGRIAP